MVSILLVSCFVCADTPTFIYSFYLFFNKVKSPQQANEHLSELHYTLKVDQIYWQNSIVHDSLLCAITIVYNSESEIMVFSVIH
jgi:hypothetical protein